MYGPVTFNINEILRICQNFIIHSKDKYKFIRIAQV